MPATDHDPDALRRARERAGQSTTDMAHAVGVSERNWRRWESGAQTPAPTMIREIARHLNLDPLALLAGDEDERYGLRQLRIAAGLTLEAAAEAMGLSRPTYRHWEQGRAIRTPDKELARRFASVVGRSRLEVGVALQATRATVTA